MSSIPTKIKTEYELTRDFFQRLAENRADDLKPILQIQESRSVGDGSSIRLRISDGTYSSGTVLLKGEGARKYKLNKMENSQSIIKVLEFFSKTTLKDNTKRIKLTINDFELLVEDCSVIGNPVRYPGIPEKHLTLRNDNVEQRPLKESVSQALPKEVSRVVRKVANEPSENDPSIVPILSINPYLMQWKIQGVVTDRNVPWVTRSPSGACKIFNFYLTDKEGTEIKVSCFEDMVDKLDGLIKVSSSYTIQGNNKALKPANKRYNKTGHGYEIIVRNDVEVIKCGNSLPLPAMKINRVKLSEIKTAPEKIIDVVAVVDNMEEPADRNTKFGTKKVMNVSLIDDSATVVNLAVWEDRFNEFTSDLLHKPVILKSVEVKKHFGAGELLYVSKSRIIKTDDQGVIQEVSDWYARERSNIRIGNLPPFTDFNKNVTLHTAIVSTLNDKTYGYFNIVGKITDIEKNLVYEACPQEGCAKKVTVQNGQYYCPKCKTTSDNFKYMLLVAVEISDHSGSKWMKMFDKVAEEFFKKTASEVGSILETHGRFQGRSMVISNLIGTIHNFGVKYKLELYKEREVTRWSVANVKPVNLAKYAEYLRESCSMPYTSTKINKKEYELTRGFFQLLVENNVDRLKPIVQIMNSHPTKDGSIIRLRLSDGTFFYGDVLLEDDGVGKFKSYGMEKSQSVIKLLGFCSNIANNDNAKKVHLYIFDFELIDKDSPIIGTPIPHTGIPVAYTVFRNEKRGRKPMKKSNSQFPLKEATKVVKNVNKKSPDMDVPIVPIVAISPQLKQWQITGVVTYKSEIQYYETLRGSGEAFDFSITDKEGTEIKITCFDDMVHKYNKLVELYSTYIIKGNYKALRVAKRISNTSGHEYEIVIKNDVDVIKCGNSVPLPPQRINRVSLSKIDMFLGEYIDVIAVVHNMEESVKVNDENRVFNKMKVSLIDESGSLVTLTIWGDSCNVFTEESLHKPLILKSLRVTESGGIFNLTFGSRSKIIPPEDVGIFKEISDWYVKEHCNIQISNISSSPMTINKNATIHSVIVTCLNNNNIKEGYFNTICRISNFKMKLVYEACPQEGCREKVVAQDGQYHCSKCNITSNKFKYVLMVIFQIYDHSGSQWLTVYDNVAERLLKRRTSEILSIINAHGELEGCNIFFSNLINTLHDFKVRFKVVSYKGRAVAKCCCVDVKPVNLTKYTDYLKEWCKCAEGLCSKYGI
uniref:Probable replication factor A 73 kDa subunit (inferred by orthology to a C. elegans protein) n=1 Tax=Strongyloides venezuelensis TaxID=75913 RepID=A0A0K0G2V8_STRVS